MVLLLLGVLGSMGCKRDRGGSEEEDVDPLVRRASRLLLDQEQNDQRIWVPEVEALEYESVLTAVVDRIRFSANRLEDLKELAFGDLRFRRPGAVRPIDWGAEEFALDGVWTKWDAEAWGDWVAELQNGATTIDYFSLTLARFRPGSAETNGLAGGTVALECHARHPAGSDEEGMVYHALKGELSVTWDRPLIGAAKIGPMASVTVEDLRWRRHSGAQAFVEKRRYAVGDPEKREPVRITPILVQDLDGDQRAEIILGGVNLLLRNQGEFQFQDEAFLPGNIHLNRVGVIADFTGDGHVDVLGMLPDGSSILVEGEPGGGFSNQVRQPWAERALHPSGLSVADIDGDGDLDVWLAQSRPTYDGAALPASLTDANDGFPSRLFANDGTGSFVDITEEAELGAQRSRRTNSSGFLDFDGDGDADLLVASDYAGLELHRNNGHGVFTNTTGTTFGRWRLFGLCAAVGRFDFDDQVDVFVGGRWSLAMHRIDALQLERADFPDFRTNAIQMASGNQLFLSQRQYETGPFNPDAKNTGWTNSAAAADFDNDDDDDLYLTTGHMTGRSVSDFDSHFWRHDFFLADGVPAEVLQAYFQTEALTPRLSALRRGEISWYGYEPNRLQVNGDEGFADLAYLHGVSLHQDSPTALAADLDNDGRVDLLTVAQRTFPSGGRLAIEQSLVIHENALPTDGHWLGVHLVPNAPGFPKMGATIRLEGAFGVRERFLSADLTASAQGPATAHFGLGKHRAVALLSVQWGNGHEQVIVEPALDRYHAISPGLDFTPIPDPPPPPPEESEESEESNS